MTEQSEIEVEHQALIYACVLAVLLYPLAIFCIWIIVARASKV
jgi:hypothetical protein